MFVNEKMTPNPITISADDYISTAVNIFDRNQFHMLPVVDGNKRVIGELTSMNVAENVPSKATTLSIHELNYLLNQTKVSDIMNKKVVAIDANALLEEAADLMIKEDVFSLPVTENDKLVGIITEHDIFNAFIEIQGYYNKGTRLTIVIDEDKPGILKEIATILTEEKISISHLVVEHGVNIKIIIRVSETNSEKIVNLLNNKYKIIDARTFN